MGKRNNKIDELEQINLENDILLKNKSKTPLPADPIDPDFQYTISPSKSSLCFNFATPYSPNAVLITPQSG